MGGDGEIGDFGCGDLFGGSIKKAEVSAEWPGGVCASVGLSGSKEISSSPLRELRRRRNVGKVESVRLGWRRMRDNGTRSLERQWDRKGRSELHQQLGKSVLGRPGRTERMRQLPSA